VLETLNFISHFFLLNLPNFKSKPSHLIKNFFSMQVKNYLSSFHPGKVGAANYTNFKGLEFTVIERKSSFILFFFNPNYLLKSQSVI